MKTSLKRLVLDTATDYLFVSFYEDKDEINYIYQKGHQNHSETLVSSIEHLLKEENLHIKDIDEIYVGIGPGSYTGIKIAVVVAKMFSYTLNIPLFKVSSLALIASSKKGKNMAYIDARRGNGFIGLYQVNDFVTLVEEDQFITLETMKEKFPEYNIIESGKPNMSYVFGTSLCQRVDDVHGLTPIYLRNTEAQRNLEKSQNIQNK
jgi:tRNA threonylcarbamoyladenosine biosynthesis protein TsaB